MTDTIEVHIDHDGETCLVGRCRYVAKHRGQSSVFEYADEWLDRTDAFALDPENLPLVRQQIYTTSDKTGCLERCATQRPTAGANN